MKTTRKIGVLFKQSLLVRASNLVLFNYLKERKVLRLHMESYKGFLGAENTITKKKLCWKKARRAWLVLYVLFHKRLGGEGRVRHKSFSNIFSNFVYIHWLKPWRTREENEQTSNMKIDDKNPTKSRRCRNLRFTNGLT